MTRLTWLGHSCWLVESGAHRVMVDPFLDDNPAARKRVKDFDPSQGKAIETILVTHGHGDHVADAAAVAKANHSTVVANYEIATWLAEKQGVAQTIGMNLGGWAKIAGGRVKMVPALHSSVLPDGTYGGNPGGFVLELGGSRIYFAGDTALFSDMQLIGAMGLDAAILPIGDLFTMGPEDSVAAIKWLNPKKVLPTHYNTWPPIEQDASQWAARVQRECSASPIILAVDESCDV